MTAAQTIPTARPPFEELALLWPRLGDALPRDVGTHRDSSAVNSNASSTAAGPCVLNLEVAEARQAIAVGLRKISEEVVPLLGLDPRRPRTVEHMLHALPHWYDNLCRRDQPLASHICEDVGKWLGRARRALGLQTRSERLGRLCPNHRDEPAELVRDADRATLAESILDGRGQHRGADGRTNDAPLTWKRGAGVHCPSCRTSWAGDAELRILMAMIDEADATTTAAGLLDTQAVAAALDRDPKLIRLWAAQGRLTRRGTGPRGRALFDLAEARQLSDSSQRRNRTPGPEHDDAPAPRERGTGRVAQLELAGHAGAGPHSGRHGEHAIH